ncbi:MAG: gliding motility protein GldL [Bacteroidota bacterium]
MSFIKSKGFKYVKNLIIGVGAAVVLVGALFKLNSWPGAELMLTVGLLTEAGLFLLLGILPPDKDYYWEKLYPGLDTYSSTLSPLTQGAPAQQLSAAAGSPLNGDVVEQQLGGMLTELQTMSRSMSSLKALQDADFSGTSEQIKAMNNFYTKMNEAMANLGDSLEDTKRYKEQLSALNHNLSSLNNVYGGVLTAMTNINYNSPNRK